MVTCQLQLITTCLLCKMAHVRLRITAHHFPSLHLMPSSTAQQPYHS